MPLYEYQCESCGHRFERIRKFSDPPVAACPQCGGPVRKLISSPAFQFKGSGFYITDYPKSGKASEAEKSDKAAAGESASAEKGEKAEKADTSKTDSSSSPAKSESSGGDSKKPSDTTKKETPAKPAGKSKEE
jgi:putative FmdB family regulatory protein